MRSSGAAELAGGLSALAAEDVTSLPDPVLRDELVELMVAVNRLHAQVLRRVEAFDARGLAGADGCRSATSWLRAFGRLSAHAASGWVTSARVLRRLPALAQAAVSGRVPAEQLGRVSTLVERVGVEPVRDVDRVLADAAARLDPGRFQQVCDRVRSHLDPDGAEPDAHEDYQRRGITVSAFDGMLLVRGQLDPEGGAALQTALDAVTPPPSGDDERSPAQRRADALVELARGALTAGQLPTVAGVRPQVAIVLTPDVLAADVRTPDVLTPAVPAPAVLTPGVPAPDVPAGAAAMWPDSRGKAQPAAGQLHRGIPPPAEPPWLEWVGPIARSTARRVACDADVWRVVLDPASGLPLDVGRAHRLVPHWIRKALWARDRGCRFPGCHAPSPWTDAHHLRTPWVGAGTTDIDNLILLCRHHHVLVHEGGWTVHLDRRSGIATATRPDGTPYEIAPSGPWTGPSTQAA